MNILFAFKAEPDSGMLAEKTGWRRRKIPGARTPRCCAVLLVPMSRRLRHYCWRNVVKVVI